MPDFQRRPQGRGNGPRQQRQPPLPTRRPDRGNGAANEDLGQRPQQDTGAQDTGAQDTGAQDTGAQDTGAQDTGAQDTGTQDTAGQGQDHGALATTERTRVSTSAVSGLPTAVDATSNADLKANINAAVQAAAVAAFDACMTEVLAEAGHPGQAATQAEVSSARSAYDAGPGVAVGKFSQYLDDARGNASANDTHLQTALDEYNQRTTRSVTAYTGIQANDSVALLGSHISGVTDGANAEANIQDVVEGNNIERSGYGNGPGGEVEPNDTVLDAIVTLSATYTFRITEIAGGSHSENSQHYPGNAIDVDRIDGAGVTSRNRSVAGFKQACTDLGATLVLGPGDSGHDTHVHAQW